MGLFDKKFCDVCGEKIGLLGNRKLENGNLCKDCAKKLSPWFDERRHSTVEQIKAQLAYREENQRKANEFRVTRVLGRGMMVMLDEDQGKFVVTRSNDIPGTNPDVIDFSQVTGCHIDVQELRTEIMREKPDGTEESYRPPRYDIDYDFQMTINVNSPWFDEISFKLNNSRIEQRGSMQYQECQREGEEIVAALTSARQTVRDNIAAAAAPKMAVTCPWCGATTKADANGCCEYCGGVLNG